MNTMRILLVGLLLVATSLSFAQVKQSEEQFEQAKKCYLNALDSENQGVRDSAILQVVKVKVKYPDENYQTIIRKLQKLSKRDDVFYIRTHAYLACEFFKHPELAQMINPADYQVPAFFFDQLYQKITESPLAMN